MTSARNLETFGVPLALAALGYFAPTLTVKMLQSLELQYGLTKVHTVFYIVLWSVAGGLSAGIAAVLVQRRKPGRQRWALYRAIALSVPASALVVCAIEAMQPRLIVRDGPLAYPATPLDFAAVPFWILAVGFWVPFLLLLKKPRPAPTPAMPA